MTQEELDFLFVTQLDNSISIQYEVLRNLTQPVFEQYKAIHNKYLYESNDRNNCGSCVFDLVNRVYNYANKYQESIAIAEQSSEAPTQDSANGKKSKKKVDANL
jgi:hypothetical protein